MTATSSAASAPWATSPCDAPVPQVSAVQDSQSTDDNNENNNPCPKENRRNTVRANALPTPPPGGTVISPDNPAPPTTPTPPPSIVEVVRTVRGPRVVSRNRITRLSAREVTVGAAAATVRASQSGRRIRVLVRGRILRRGNRGCGGVLKIGTRAGGNRVTTRRRRRQAELPLCQALLVPRRPLKRSLRPRSVPLRIGVQVRYQGNSRVRGSISPRAFTRVRR